ncbi:DUF1223 domain-containing protein [Amaricoccus solimangrovi]|uniref:DUF1223 domain-containing protein n=1 Tax=Amaricoccus solimangrovi TaxID=2589815 RepID=A0A501X105_9RHOB|nr:DUF1223 domain-containing protein [Amaricoccus solimangrovi]TPE52946.1 DUF1223 domain-containing protein [Amaricoccus solimangrovi]
MRLLACLLTLLIAAPGLVPCSARAQQSAEASVPPLDDAGRVPVVVEFYTSQGCVTCPPADALFGEIAKDRDVIALAMHVTYWDYLGWADIFGKPEFDLRQKAYARVMRQRTLFTPQMIIQGEDMLIGRDAKTVTDRIDAHRGLAPTVRLGVERGEEDSLRVTLAPAAGEVGQADVNLFAYMPSAEVEITAGQNAGQTVRYTNVVTQWNTLAQWDGESELEFDFGPVPQGPLAVLVQRHGLGGILAAARVD